MQSSIGEDKGRGLKQSADRTVERIAFIQSNIYEDKGWGLKQSADRVSYKIMF